MFRKRHPARLRNFLLNSPAGAPLIVTDISYLHTGQSLTDIHSCRNRGCKRLLTVANGSKRLLAVANGRLAVAVDSDTDHRSSSQVAPVTPPITAANRLKAFIGKIISQYHTKTKQNCVAFSIPKCQPFVVSRISRE